MKGVYTSKGFSSETFKVKKYSISFNSEKEFWEILTEWAKKAVVALKFSKYHYKNERIFEFFVDDESYFFILPPFLKTDKILKNETFFTFEKLEEINDYLIRNKTYIREQLIDIEEQVKNGKRQPNLIELTTNIFQDIQLRKTVEGFETVFTDEQAISLCKKLSTPFVRKLLINSRNNIEELQQIAMKCYNKYGGQIISFLLLLPPMNFGNRHSKYFIEKSEFNGDIPSFKLKFFQSGDEYYFSFYPNISTAKGNKKIATVFNKTKNRVEGFISHLGYWQRKVSSQNLKANFFVDMLLSSKKVFYCGVADGYCLNCNRELSDPKSLRVGYGKECAAAIGIPYE